MRRPGGWRDEQGAGRPVRTEIIGGIYGNDPFSRASFGKIDLAELRMSVIATEKRSMQHSRQVHVIHELRAAGEQPRVFVPPDRLTNQPTHVETA